MDTITTPRLNFFLRWRSARARCTTVPPASEASACGVRPRGASFGSAVVSAASSFAVAAACEPATDPAPTAAPAPPPALAPSFDPAEPFEPIASVSPGWISLSLSAERCKNFLYSCDATADTTEPTPTPIAEPYMPICEASSMDVTAASAPATTWAIERSSKSPPNFPFLLFASCAIAYPPRVVLAPALRRPSFLNIPEDYEARAHSIQPLPASHRTSNHPAPNSWARNGTHDNLEKANGRRSIREIFTTWAFARHRCRRRMRSHIVMGAVSRPDRRKPPDEIHPPSDRQRPPTPLRAGRAARRRCRS